VPLGRGGRGTIVNFSFWLPQEFQISTHLPP
jgi:hypothetical protein